MYRGDFMATKSILKTIDIKDKRLAHMFASALENSENSKDNPVKISHECIELKGDDVRNFFLNNKRYD